MNSIDAFLSDYKGLISSHLNDVRCFVEDDKLINICENYNEAKERIQPLGFNVFALTSDLYYRENFHSDIIKSFLNPKENHNQGNIFLNALIDLLNQSFGDRIKINKKHYLDAEVRREYGKREYGQIDILVLSENSNHCIIIENKMNNAVDMARQLPRYYDFMVSKGFVVDVIIYIPLQKYKRPDTSDWSKDDRKHVSPILIHLPAFANDGTPNLVDNWIIPCSMLTNDIDCYSILRQYGSLIKSLNINTMDKITLTKFYDTLLENNNIETAQSIKAMLEEIPVLMASRLYERLLSDVRYGNVWNGYKPNFCGVIFTARGKEYKIDTYSTLDGYEMYLFPNEANRTSSIPWIESVDGLKNEDRKATGEFYFKFPFKAEEDVVLFILKLLAAAESCELGVAE